jgi:hypothetical protein
VIEGLPVDNLILVAGGLLLIGILLIGVSDRLRVPAALLSLSVWGCSSAATVSGSWTSATSSWSVTSA